MTTIRYQGQCLADLHRANRRFPRDVIQAPNLEEAGILAHFFPRRSFGEKKIWRPGVEH